MPGRPLALALVLLTLTGCAESTSAAPRVPVKTAAAPACPAKAVDRQARAHFAAAALPALATLREGVVAPIASGRGADIVVRVEAWRANGRAITGLRRAGTVVHADPVLCRALAAPLDALLGTVMGLQANLNTPKPDAKLARAAGTEAAAFRAVAIRAGVRSLR